MDDTPRDSAAARVDAVGRQLVPDPMAAYLALELRAEAAEPRRQGRWSTALAVATISMLLALPVAALFASHALPGRPPVGSIASGASPSPGVAASASPLVDGRVTPLPNAPSSPQAAVSGNPVPVGHNSSAAPGKPAPTPVDACLKSEVRVEAIPQKTAYAIGEPVQFTLRATNTSTRTCTAYVSACWDPGTVRDSGGTLIWQSQQGGYNVCGPGMPAPHQQLSPGGSAGIDFVWNQQDCSQSAGVPCTGTPVKPGHYSVGGNWGLGDGRVEAIAKEVTIG
jgi:hypothetical protein